MFGFGTSFFPSFIVIGIIFLVIFVAMTIIILRMMKGTFNRMGGITDRVNSVFDNVTAQNAANQSAPRLTVEARVLSKRQQITRQFTHYFVTFEKNDGERFELSVTGQLSGLLVEGDYGIVTVQGTNCVQFERR